MAQFNLGEYDASAKNFAKAYELRDRVSERERFYIEAGYHSFVTGDLLKADQIYTDWIAAYPEDFTPYANLALNQMLLGQNEKVIESTRQALRLRPDSGAALGNLMSAYVSLGRLDEAKDVYQRSITQHVDSIYTHLQRYYIAFLQNDLPAMQQQLDWGNGHPSNQWQFLLADSAGAAYQGELAKARALAQQAERQAKAADNPEQVAIIIATWAGQEAEFGNITAARQQFAAAGHSNSRDGMVTAAVAFAATGDSSRAEKLADQLNLQFPSDTIIQSYWLPTLRAMLALNRKNPQQALSVLGTTLPYELGDQGYWPMLPTYVRGKAYLQAGQAQQAAAEFSKLSQHPGIVKNSPMGALARLQLARAQAMAGNAAGARVSYQDFFGLWKNADPTIPIFLQAKMEYAKLK